METIQLYISTAIGITLVVLAVMILVAFVLWTLSILFNSSELEQAGYFVLQSMVFVGFITLILAVGMLGVTVVDSSHFLYGH